MHIYIPHVALVSFRKMVNPAIEAVSGDPPTTGHRGHGGSGRKWGYMAVLGRVRYSHMLLCLLPVVIYRL